MKKKIAIGAAGLAVLGGAGAAYGVTQSGGNDRQAFLNDLAGRLKVSPQQLNNALKGAFEDRLQAAVQAGRLTQAQANAIKKKVEQGGAPPVFGFGPGPGGPGGPGFFMHRGPGGPVKAGIGAAAKYLGLTDRQLIQKLALGKSLADVAGDQNKPVDGLKSAIKGAVKTDLDAAVKDQRLTQAQENNLLSKLDSRIDDLVNRKGLGPGPRFRGPWGPKHGGMRFGAAPAGGPPPGAPII
jgi:AraC-like DNA-binding protein